MHSPSATHATDGSLTQQLDALAREYGNRFLLEPAPDGRIPGQGMRAVDAMRLIGEELVLDGIPMGKVARRRIREADAARVRPLRLVREEDGA